MIRYDSSVETWSRNGQAMAFVVAGEVVLAITAIANVDFHRPRVLVIAAAIGIASAVLVARSRMPTAVKATLIAVVCATMLALAAAQDPFGLRAVDRSIDRATRDAFTLQAAVSPTEAMTSAKSSQTALRATGDAAATAFAEDLARSVAAKAGPDTGPEQVDGIVDIAAGKTGDSYRLTWSIRRAGDTLWCGRIVATGQKRATVLDSFSTTIAKALRDARGRALTCS